MKTTYRFLCLLTVLIISISFWSCSKNDPDIDDINKETVFVFMPWSGSDGSDGLYKYFQQNIESIENAIIEEKGLDHKRVMLFLSESPEISKLYEITYENNKCVWRPIKTYTGQLYTTSEGISTIINDVKNTAPALNFGMIIGCHGMGWTQKNIWREYPYNIRKKRNMLFTTRFYGSVSNINKFATDIDVLAKGIEDTKVKFQYIMFDDCYMANVEVAYSLRNATNFLIASTSEILAIGVPYQQVWKYLASPTPSYSSVTDEFLKFYSNYTVPCGALSVIDCRKMEEFAQIMKKINQNYSFDNANLSEVQPLDGFDVPIFFDFKNYISKLNLNKAMQAEFNKILTETIKSTVHTKTLYSYLYAEPKYITLKEYCGISISDPSKNPVVLRGKEKTLWWKATH